MKKSILISINPIYVEKILKKEKIFEFRKVFFKQPHTNKIYIYSTSPESKIIACAEIEKSINDLLKKVWKITKNHSGITLDFFNNYYKNKDKAIAYKLKNVQKFNHSISLKDLGIKTAPQSFMYINQTIENKLKAMMG